MIRFLFILFLIFLFFLIQKMFKQSKTTQNNISGEQKKRNGLHYSEDNIVEIDFKEKKESKKKESV